MQEVKRKREKREKQEVDKFKIARQVTAVNKFAFVNEFVYKFALILH